MYARLGMYISREAIGAKAAFHVRLMLGQVVMKDVRMKDGMSECQTSDTIISTSSGGSVVMVEGQGKLDARYLYKKGNVSFGRNTIIGTQHENRGE